MKNPPVSSHGVPAAIENKPSVRPLVEAPPTQTGLIIITTTLGNHYASTYDPQAAKMIQAGPELYRSLVQLEFEASRQGRNAPMLVNALEDTRELLKKLL